MQMRVKCRRYMPQNILKYMTVFSFLFHISTLDHVSVCFQLSIMQMSENVRWTAKLSSVRILLQTQTKDLQKLAVSKQQPTHLDIMTWHTVKPLESKHQSSRAMTAHSDSVSLWWKQRWAQPISRVKNSSENQESSTNEAELHKLTAKKMTIVKITRDSSLLWIQVSLTKWQEKDWRADKKYLSFSWRRKNVPCLPLWLKHSLELVLLLSVGALVSSSYEHSSARVVKLLLIFFHFCQILLLIYFGNSI